MYEWNYGSGWGDYWNPDGLYSNIGSDENVAKSEKRLKDLEFLNQSGYTSEVSEEIVKKVKEKKDSRIGYLIGAGIAVIVFSMM